MLAYYQAWINTALYVFDQTGSDLSESEDNHQAIFQYSPIPVNNEETKKGTR